MSVKLPIFLDHNSTTPVDPRVLEVMLPYFSEIYGNPASKTHTYGHDAQVSVENARIVLADSINAEPNEIFFTSGATESLNMAIKGVANPYSSKGRHFITVATEHNAVLDCYKYLEADGMRITVLPVDRRGRVSLEELANSIKQDTILVAIMAANNEIGTIHPIEDIGFICHQKDVLFLTDATQALGKIPINVEQMNIDLLACSSHKIYGPKGVGALYKRRRNPRVKISPLMHGGGHERGLRSGTLNVPGIVGFSKAVEIALSDMNEEQKRLCDLRDLMQNTLTSAIDGAVVNGDQKNRLAGNLNISLPGVESEALMVSLKGDVAFSSGSACTSEEVRPSHVLSALGIPDHFAYNTLRFGMGRYTSIDEVKYCIKKVLETSSLLNEMNLRPA